MPTPDLEDGAQDTQGAQPAQPTGRGQDCLLMFCCIVNLVTAASALLCLTALLMSAAQHAGAASQVHDQWTGTRQQVLRAYGIATAGMLALVETESQWVSHLLGAPSTWIGRGALQALLSVLTFEFAVPASATGEAAPSDYDLSMILYRDVAGTAMLSCAVFYAFGGLLCVGVIKQYRKRSIEERAKAEEELALLEKKREGLRQKLATLSRR